jgi:hypothetical protein
LASFYGQWNVSGASVDGVSSYGSAGQVGGDNWFGDASS